MAYTNFFGGAFFGGGFFGAGTSDVVTGGKGDNAGGKRKSVAFKPTGLLHLPKKEGRKSVEERIAETADIHAEVETSTATQFVSEQYEPSVAKMSLTEVEREIGVLIRKSLRTEEDELLLLLLMTASLCA